jgi:hypothetical protein
MKIQITNTIKIWKISWQQKYNKKQESRPMKLHTERDWMWPCIWFQNVVLHQFKNTAISRTLLTGHLITSNWFRKFSNFGSSCAIYGTPLGEFAQQENSRVCVAGPRDTSVWELSQHQLDGRCKTRYNEFQFARYPVGHVTNTKAAEDGRVLGTHRAVCVVAADRRFRGACSDF